MSWGARGCLCATTSRVIGLLQVENPKAEDVECLCKLLVTIGGMLDANPVKNKDRMDAYFSRLGRLATHPKLESRHKFMVQVGNCLPGVSIQAWTNVLQRAASCLPAQTAPLVASTPSVLMSSAISNGGAAFP